VSRVLELIERVENAPPVVLGGVVTLADRAYLSARGVRAIYNAQTPVERIVTEIANLAAERRRGLPAG
jgi:methylmalonyl-CoA mutase cobalamin-binding subunit